MIRKILPAMLSFFSVRLCRFCVVIRFFHPRHNGQWPPTSKDFLSQIVSITFIWFIFWERANIFPFECSVLNKGTTGTTFITSLVWRGPWLGIEPGTSRTRSQHCPTRLSRRRLSKCYLNNIHFQIGSTPPCYWLNIYVYMPHLLANIVNKRYTDCFN